MPFHSNFFSNYKDLIDNLWWNSHPRLTKFITRRYQVRNRRATGLPFSGMCWFLRIVGWCCVGFDSLCLKFNFSFELKMIFELLYLMSLTMSICRFINFKWWLIAARTFFRVFVILGCMFLEVLSLNDYSNFWAVPPHRICAYIHSVEVQ